MSQAASLVFHAREDDETTHLCKQVWTHPGIIIETSSHCLAWAGDVFRPEPACLSTLVGAPNFPKLAIIEPMQHGGQGSREYPRGTFFRVRWASAGRVQPDDVYQHLLRLRGERSPSAGLLHLQDLLACVLQQHERDKERDKELNTTEEEERPCFAAIFESRYLKEAPPHYEGSFVDALLSARAQRKLLLVWLYGESEVEQQLFNDVLSGELFQTFVSEYFIFWPGDAKRWLIPSKLFDLLHLQATPALLVLKPLNVYEVDIASGTPVEFPAGSAWSLLGKWDATADGTSEDVVIPFLLEFGERVATMARDDEERQRQQQIRSEEFRLLREEQDREFEESLLHDTIRANSLVESSQQPPPVEEDVDAHDECINDTDPSTPQVAQLDDKIAERRRAIAEEFLSKEVPTGETCKLVVRMPNGCRVERVFGADEQVSSLYAWVDCCGEMKGLEGGSTFEVPHDFSLSTTYPRTELTDQDKSFREYNLLPNAVLALRATDAS